MLTEQDFENTIRRMMFVTDDGFKLGGAILTSQTIHSQHLAETERLMKLAFNAAKAKRTESDFPYPLEKYRTYNDFKEDFVDK